jgi:hypothetical protein
LLLQLASLGASFAAGRLIFGYTRPDLDGAFAIGWVFSAIGMTAWRLIYEAYRSTRVSNSLV